MVPQSALARTPNHSAASLPREASDRRLAVDSRLRGDALAGRRGATIGRLTLEPGWCWSEHAKSIAQTDWCLAPHFQYHLAGRLHIVMADGTELEAGPGEAIALPQGHDA